MTIKIIGAGMAGLLAANMLRRHDPTVLERSPALPNNHSAVLRFRTPIVGDVLGIEFKKVRVIRDYLPWQNRVADALAYSDKNTGMFRSDRSIAETTASSDRYIAPPDLIEKMARGLDIRFGCPHDFADRSEKVISTIPMPTLMQLIDYPTEQPFSHRPGVNVRAQVEDCDAYVSLYIPDPDLPFSRVSITGSELIVESQGTFSYSPEVIAEMASGLLGIDNSRISQVSESRQAYHKILPIEEGARRRFIYWASTEKNIAFSLGRFATWRPGLLADDLVKDIRIIEKMITSSSPGYDAERHERSRGSVAEPLAPTADTRGMPTWHTQ